MINIKRTFCIILSAVFCILSCFTLSSCGEKVDYTVGICQLSDHDSAENATRGFMDAVTEELKKAGKTVSFNIQIAKTADLCEESVNELLENKVSLIMANSTPAVLAAADSTVSIPVLGTSVTDYNDAFVNNIPPNVTGTSDAVSAERQGELMTSALNLTPGDTIGAIYCAKESNSLVQYNAIKAYFEAKGITVKPYSFTEASELQELTASAAAECKAVYLPSDNKVASNEALIAPVTQEYSVPVFSSYHNSICFASLGVDYYTLGRETGKMAAEILLGKKTVGDFPIKVLSPTVKYNKEICLNLGISVKKFN